MNKIEVFPALSERSGIEAIAINLLFYKLILIKPSFKDSYAIAKLRNDVALVELHKNILRHEIIHLKQQGELFIVFAYLLYIIEFIIKSALLKSFTKGYKAISLEQEAFRFQHLSYYMEIRPKYAFVKYIFSLNYDYFVD